MIFTFPPAFFASALVESDKEVPAPPASPRTIYDALFDMIQPNIERLLDEHGR